MFDNFTLKNTKTGNQVEFNFEEGETPTPTPSGDVSNSTVTFTEAQTRTNIATGEKLSVICGKIKKFFTDLKAVAFSGSYNDLTDKPSIPTVNNATLTIKQGGTTKGTFTANASTDVEIDLDAGGGGTEYTAGDGITISNNVISVTNPINKVGVLNSRVNIPCLYNDGSKFYKLDGTVATLSDCLDLGTFNHDFGGFLYIRYILNIFSATFQEYDWSSQSHTQDTFSDIEKDTGYQNAYKNNGDLFDTYLSNNVSIRNGEKNVVFPFILGKKNGHLYICIASSCYGGIATNEYAESMEASFEVQLVGF